MLPRAQVSFVDFSAVFIVTDFFPADLSQARAPRRPDYHSQTLWVLRCGERCAAAVQTLKLP
jgi:hypothetical protein